MTTNRIATKRARDMSEEQLREHAAQTISLPESFPSAPDVKDGEATLLSTNQDALDRLLGELIATAHARDADDELVEQLSTTHKIDVQLHHARSDLRTHEGDQEHARTARKVFERKMLGKYKTREKSKRQRIGNGATPAVLGIIGLAEAALLYPAMRYALPAPEAYGMLGTLLKVAPTAAALAIGLASAVAQKHIGRQLALAHRGVISDPSSPISS